MKSPCSAKAMAAAFPMPEEQPVMRTISFDRQDAIIARQVSTRRSMGEEIQRRRDMRMGQTEVGLVGLWGLTADSRAERTGRICSARG